MANFYPIYSPHDMRGADLLAWLSSIEPRARDEAIEAHLGIDGARIGEAPPGDHLIGYQASGVAPIVHALAETGVDARDVVIDLGAGLGKVVLLTRLLTEASARGIELQADLVVRAKAAAARLALDVRFDHGDARACDLDDGTVFFLYAPFTGPVLVEVLARLRAIAERRAIVVCALGIDLPREARWLVARPLDAFWLTIYDSAVPGVAPRAPRSPAPLGPHVAIIAGERPL
jgi:hypothetical protein